MKVYRRQDDPATGQFLGLYESLGFLVVRGDQDEHFLDYGYCKENSKILQSFIKKEFLAYSVGHFLIDISYNLKAVVYRLHIQMFIMASPQQQIEVKKLIDIWDL